MNEKDSLLLNDVTSAARFIHNDPFWLAQVEQIDITADRNFEMTPTIGNHTVKLGNGEDIDKKFHRLFIFYKEVMSKTGFAYDTPTIKEKVTLRDRIIKTDPNKDAYDSRTSSQYLNDKTDVRYMKAVISKPGMLTELASKYHFDLFVFVTQMEIKTNYASCMDIANKIYKREVILHFTVYDKSGTLLVGNFAQSFFPSNSNNAYTISGNCFPQVAQGIIDSLK